MKNTTKRLAAGTLMAGIVGYVAGILTAPKSGKETRQDIKDTTARSIGVAEKELKVLHTQLAALLGSARERAGSLTGAAKKDIDKAVETAKVAKEKAREILSAVHEGDVSDKDLKKAVEEAREAVNHLKTYFSK